MSYRHRSKRLKRVKKQTGDGEMSGAGSKGRADAKSNIPWAGKIPAQKTCSSRVARRDRAACRKFYLFYL